MTWFEPDTAASIASTWIAIAPVLMIRRSGRFTSSSGTSPAPSFDPPAPCPFPVPSPGLPAGSSPWPIPPPGGPTLLPTVDRIPLTWVPSIVMARTPPTARTATPTSARRQGHPGSDRSYDIATHLALARHPTRELEVRSRTGRPEWMTFALGVACFHAAGRRSGPVLDP